MFDAQKLDSYLKDKRMSSEEFAERVGVTYQMVASLRRGLKQPSVALLKRIAREMGCLMDELVRE